MTTLKDVTRLSAEVKALRKLFLTVKQNGIIHYDVMSKVIDCRAQDNRSILYAARKVVLEEAGIVFVPVFKKGYRRLTTEEIWKIGEQARMFIRNKANLVTRRMTVAQEAAGDQTAFGREQIAEEVRLLSTVAQITSIVVKENFKKPGLWTIFDSAVNTVSTPI